MRPIQLHVEQHQPRPDLPFQSAGPSLLRPNPSGRSQGGGVGQQDIAGQIIVPHGLHDQEICNRSDDGDMDMPSAPPLSAIEVSSQSAVRVSDVTVERERIVENHFWREEHICPLSLALLHDAVEAADRHVYSRPYVAEYFDRYGAFSPKSNIPLASQTGGSNVELKRRSSLQANVEAERSKRSTRACIQPEEIFLNDGKEDPQALEGPCKAQTLASATDSALSQARLGTGRNRVLLKGMWNGVRVLVAHDAREVDRAQAVYDYVGMHPHILTCHGYLDNGDAVLEYAPLGSLAQVLSSLQPQAQNKNVTFRVQRDSARQICSAMAHLAELGVVHRLLMLRSVMVTHLLLTTSTASIHTKLGDLDMCSASPNTILRPVTPVRWAAPEVLNDPPQYSERSDVWSFGVVLWELLDMGRTIPYLQCWDDAMVKPRVRSGQVQLTEPDGADSVLWEIAQECVTPNKEDRPSFFDLTLEIQWRCLGGSSTQRRRPRAPASLDTQAPEHRGHHSDPFESALAPAEILRAMYDYDDGDGTGFVSAGPGNVSQWRDQAVGGSRIAGTQNLEDTASTGTQPMLTATHASAISALALLPLLLLAVACISSVKIHQEQNRVAVATLIGFGGGAAVVVAILSLDAWSNRRIPANETSRCGYLLDCHDRLSNGIWLCLGLSFTCFAATVIALTILDCWNENVQHDGTARC